MCFPVGNRFFRNYRVKSTAMNKQKKFSISSKEKTFFKERMGHMENGGPIPLWKKKRTSIGTEGLKIAL